MNLAVLKEAETAFLQKSPEGFHHPDMLAVGKRHKLEQRETMAQESFAKENFDDSVLIVTETAKLVGRSSLISFFEKPKFRDCTRAFTTQEMDNYAQELYELLHRNEEQGFNLLFSQLIKKKLARWPLMTVVQAYPQQEVFVKPTTAKLNRETRVYSVISLDNFRNYPILR